MAQWLRGTMADLATAKGELRSHANLLAGGGQPGVDRAGAAAHMSAAGALITLSRALGPLSDRLGPALDTPHLRPFHG